MAENGLKDWQRGVPLDELKAITSLIAEWDRGLVLGLATKTSERTVAEWIAEGSLRRAGSPTNVVALAVVEKAKTTRSVKDFAGSERARLEPGTMIVKKLAWKDGYVDQVPRLVPEPRPWFEGWMEKPEDVAFADARGLYPAAVKVRASSELWGVFGPIQKGGPICEHSDWPTLTNIGTLPAAFIAAAAAEIEADPPQLEDHYSSYNLKHAWAAASLRGYAPESAAADPGFIVKPSEMSAAWKKENADKLTWVLADTPWRNRWPALEPLIRAIPGKKHRIRLMNLAPGGGELARHADITDPDAGTKDGQLLRIHVPLRTNERVIFTGWNLLGEQLAAHFAEGSVWYLDTRKPHRAVNGGSAPRLHLVMDVESSRDMRALLDRGHEALRRP